MLATYLDDSGTTKDSTNITMAGYASHVSRWIEFESRSSLLFSKEGLREPFHAKEFFDTKIDFAGWDWYRKMGFAYEWFGIAATTVHKGITVSIPKEKWNAAKKRTVLAAQQSSYGHCFASVVDQVLKSWDLAEIARREGVSFFVEAGNKNNAELVKWFNMMRTQPRYASILKSLTFIEKGDCHAIQLADYLAFFSRRLANNYSDLNKLEMDELLGVAKEKVDTIAFLAQEITPAERLIS